jgi:hypothetical protein
VNTISCFWLPFYPAYYHIQFFLVQVRWFILHFQCIFNYFISIINCCWIVVL